MPKIPDEPMLDCDDDPSNGINELRALLRREVEIELREQKRVNPQRLIESLVERERGVIVSGLVSILWEEIEVLNDEHSTEAVLQTNPEVREHLEDTRRLSKTLGVPVWCLLVRVWFWLTRGDQTLGRCYAAAELIHLLRAQENQARAEANEQQRDRLLPIFDAHPGITVGEAKKLLAAETERALAGLDKE
jgi:hypothetical protein